MTLARRRSLLIAGLLVLVAMAFQVGRPAPVDAHPLGNFTVNTYSRLELYSDAIHARYVLDMAEIPAFQERQQIDTDADGVVSVAEADVYLADLLPALVANIELTLDGEPVALDARAPVLEFLDGQAGLSTLRLVFWLEAPLTADGATELRYTDANYRDRLGWRELIVEPRGSSIASTVPTDDPTNELRSYPANQIASPRVTRELAFTFTPGTAVAPTIEVPSSYIIPVEQPSTAEQPSTVEPTTSAAPVREAGGFAALIAPEQLTLSLGVIALLGAAAFGAIHALEPGHGKTLVAAYFVGARGTAIHALFLGLIVAVTHTIGVFAIGILTLVGTKYILPEDLYPWLSAASGLILVALGFTLLRPRLVAWLRRRVRPSEAALAAAGHDHEGSNDHSHEHGHHHGPDGHSHVPVAANPQEGPPWRGLIALGLADGLVPTPSTLVVLLAAVSLDRVPFGLALIASFSIGFGAVLTGLALAFVYARRWFARVDFERRGFGFASRLPLATALPVFAALVLVGLGLTLSARSLGAVL